jgi:DNA polymerase III epsilon subunit family exonuclease
LTHQIELNVPLLFSFGKPQTLTEAHAVRINRDACNDAVGCCKNDGSGLPANSSECQHLGHRPWYLATEITNQRLARFSNRFCLHAIRAAGMNVGFKCGARDSEIVFGSPILSEECLRDDVDARVGTLGREDCCNQQFKWRRPIERTLGIGIELLELSEHEINRYRRHGPTIRVSRGVPKQKNDLSIVDSSFESYPRCPMATPLPPLTVFDVETTGLDPRRGHRIIEIAGVRIENGAIDETKSFVELVNPEREIPWEARQVNKITDSDVASAPGIEAVLPRFLEFAAGSTLVAHNARFDMGFLHVEKEVCWGYVELPECLCTMRLSQALFPREFGHNLDMVARRLNLTIPKARHRALPDVLLTAHALLKMIELGEIVSIEDLRSVAAIASPVG